MRKEFKLFIVLGFLTFLYFVFINLKPEKKVDFSAKVKPILNKHCISCHRGVKKNAGFSVLFEAEALGITESGQPAIVPGNASKSELIICKLMTQTTIQCQLIEEIF